MIDPIIGGALIGGISNLLGAKSSARGIAAQNRANVAAAQKQMDFQERMRSTGYQVAAKDMKAAGLNRILALGGPAPSPGGAMPTLQNIKAPMGQAGANIGNIAANTALQLAQAELARKRADVLAPEAAIKGPAGEVIDEVITSVLKKKNEAGGWGAFAKRGYKAGVDKITQMWNSLGLQNAPRAKGAFLATLKKMDTPQGLNDEQLLEWGIQHIGRVKAYRERQKQMGN